MLYKENITDKGEENALLVSNSHRVEVYCTECVEIIIGTPKYDINGNPYHDDRCMCKGKDKRISEICKLSSRSAIRCPDPNIQETYRLWEKHQRILKNKGDN